MWIILTTYITNILCTSLSHIDGRQPKTRISKYAFVQETKKTNLFCNAILHCA